jgi:NAD(P)-dependent dehydrogenase (short-subunit alcohol dehydrogenase family)
MAYKTVLVTGGNIGIGLEFRRQYTEKGWKVYAAVRNPSDELKGLGVSLISGVDVSSDACVSVLSTGFTEATLDVLVCNAG